MHLMLCVSFLPQTAPIILQFFISTITTNYELSLMEVTPHFKPHSR